MNPIKKLALGTVLLAAVAAGAPANAATVVKGTLTANDPTFNSPNQGNPPTTTVTGTFAYDAYRFTVDTAGSYAISATSNAFNTYLGRTRVRSIRRTRSSTRCNMTTIPAPAPTRSSTARCRPASSISRS